MANIESTIQWMYDKMNQGVTYSMTNRNGPNSYDCSSAVYHALISGGFFDSNHSIGNTDSLFSDLEKNGWTKVATNSDGSVDDVRGDVIIWGKRGASSGANGHTMIFIDADNVIHCSSGYNGIHVNNHNQLWGWNGEPEFTCYRYSGTSTTASTGNPTDQNCDIGSVIKFEKTYILDDVQEVNGIWQAKINALCTTGFTWDDNGIPCSALDEVDDDGYATSDQNVNSGSKVVIPGKFTILDLGQTNGEWLALIQSGDQKFWVDIADATEIDTNVDNGTPHPTSKPIEQITNTSNNSTETPSNQSETSETTKTEEVSTNDETTSHTSSEEQETTNTDGSQSNNNKVEVKEETMAFTEADQAKLKIATESAQDVADKVADNDEVQEIVSEVPNCVKLAIYIVGDTLIGLGLIVPQLAIVLNMGTVNQVSALSGLLGVAGTFILTMFGIYKSK